MLANLKASPICGPLVHSEHNKRRVNGTLFICNCLLNSHPVSHDIVPQSDFKDTGPFQQSPVAVRTPILKALFPPPLSVYSFIRSPTQYKNELINF